MVVVVEAVTAVLVLIDVPTEVEVFFKVEEYFQLLPSPRSSSSSPLPTTSGVVVSADGDGVAARHFVGHLALKLRLEAQVVQGMQTLFTLQKSFFVQDL